MEGRLCVQTMKVESEKLKILKGWVRETEKSEDIQQKKIMGQRFEISTKSFIVATQELNLSK